MPEGDTIRRLADRLHARAAGATLTRSVFRHARWATTDLSGLVLAQVDAAGKHLLMRLHDRGGQHRLTIHSHLRMQGSWTIGTPRDTPEWRRRVELWTAEHPPLVGVDLPVLDVGRPSAEAGWIGHLGPDLCAPAFDLPRAVANVAGDDRQLGAALLDQRNVAGIGNLYAVEIPFLVGVSPWTPADQVDGLDIILAAARALLPVNARLGPQTTTGLTARRRTHWIYGRRGQPCPVCGTALEVADERDVPWGRVTTWCPGCQGAGPADARRLRRLLHRHRQAVEALATVAQDEVDRRGRVS